MAVESTEPARPTEKSTLDLAVESTEPASPIEKSTLDFNTVEVMSRQLGMTEPKKPPQDPGQFKAGKHLESQPRAMAVSRFYASYVAPHGMSSCLTYLMMPGGLCTFRPK